MSTATSFVSYDADCDFSIQNLPYGIFSPTSVIAPRTGVAIGDQILDLSVLASENFFKEIPTEGSCFAEPTLNTFMAMGQGAWDKVREIVADLLNSDTATLRDNADLRARALVPMASASMHMPAQIGDYTDFYSSREHATNVGTMFRGPDNALQPNWLHLPVGYHGRSSSVVLSGTDIRRPNAQLQKHPTDATQGPVFGPCRLMDFELEMAFFVGPGNKLGEPIPMDQANQNIFGVVMMNDWSARDVQKWEYVPLGPFTAKNVGTSISPWVVPLAALAPFKCPSSAGKQENPSPLPYLTDPDYETAGSYNVNLFVDVHGHEVSKPHTISSTNLKYMYWNMKQQLVHHSVTGCNMQPGDLLGSGTISGTEVGMLGSMLEGCWKGTREIDIADGAKRKFLQNGDKVTMRGYCQGEGFRVGFGEVSGSILPAHELK